MTMAARAARRRAAKPGSRGGLIARFSGLLVAAGILFFADGLGQSWPDRAQVDPIWNPRCFEPNGQVGFVAERLVAQLSAAAAAPACQSLPHPIPPPNLSTAA